MLFAVTCLLLPSRFQLPSSYPVETIAAPKDINGAERNRTAVRDTGVNHLVQKMDIIILAGLLICLRNFCPTKFFLLAN